MLITGQLMMLLAFIIINYVSFTLSVTAGLITLSGTLLLFGALFFSIGLVEMKRHQERG